MGAESTILAKPKPVAPLKYATFAAGCFWGVEKFFRSQFPGIKNSLVGYTGGTAKNPTYEQVCSGSTGHAEALQFEFDPASTSYKQLVEFFFQLHDPTTLNRQGNDQGTQYRSAVFYHDDEQKKIAEEVKAQVQKDHYPTKPIVTEIRPASDYWIAEAYHQNYLKNNPGGYCNHRLHY